MVGGEYINQENLSNHVCQCDKNFLEKVLEGHKKCLKGKKEFCLNDKYRYCELSNFLKFLKSTAINYFIYLIFYKKYFLANGWVSTKCHDVGMFQVNHDQCCGVYPNRRAFSTEKLTCCPDGHLTASNVC